MAESMMHAMHGRIPSSLERRLGVCVRDKSRYAKIVPKFVLCGDRWAPVIDAESDYPPDGRVFCPEFEMMNAVEGSVWEFSVKANDKPEFDDRNHRSGRRQDVVAYDATRAKPVVDLSHHATIEEARQ